MKVSLYLRHLENEAVSCLFVSFLYSGCWKTSLESPGNNAKYPFCIFLDNPLAQIPPILDLSPSQEGSINNRHLTVYTR